MRQTTHKPRFARYAIFVLTLFACLLFFSQNSCYAKVSSRGLTESQLDAFSGNNIMFYNPGECMRKIDSTSCFRVDSTTEANQFWYPEGCLNNGRCTSGIYASTAYTSSSTNAFLLNDTEVDEEFGGLQYIYAENYDIEFDAYEGWIAKFTPNGGNSTQKYYWIVLPAEAYATGFGETYVATFENLDEPIYFITYDTHQCVHQSAQYCEKATADPDGVEIGPEFFGAFSTAGGASEQFVEKAGKLKTFCRIQGKGEILAHENGKGFTNSGSSDSSSDKKTSNSNSSNSSSDKKTSNSNSSTTSSEQSKDISGKDITWIGDSYSCGAISIIKETFADISFGDSECDANSYIMSNKGVGDRYGGGEANPPALTILQRLSDAGELKKYVVMAVGTNGGWDDNEVDQLNSIMASNPDTKVIFVTAKAGVNLMSDDNGTNDRLKALVESNDNYYLADWAAAYDPSYFAENSTHPTANGGYEKWVEVIKDALSQASEGCNSFEGNYPQYFQDRYEESDHENSSTDWTSIQYSGDALSVTGCGPTSMAMLATVATGKDIYPQDIVDITVSKGTYVLMSPTELDPLVGEKYGFEVIPETYSSKDDAYKKIKDYLSKGYMIHLSGEGVHQGFAEYYTPGHYIGLFSMDENEQVWVANSYFSGNSQAPLQEIIDAIHNGVFTAIKGDGNGGGQCFNYCKDNNGDLSEGGLTEEQAKTFMMNYGDNKNNSSYNAVGPYMWNSCNGGGSNCVTFSAFFMSKFTSIGQEGLWGAGDEVVPNLKARSKVDATFGTEPKVYAILSTTPPHTAVILGHHDGKWIIGHADCYYTGIGRGTGGSGNLNDRGGGAGFYSVEEGDDPSKWIIIQGRWYSFAYPDNVYTDKIEEYLENGV